MRHEIKLWHTTPDLILTAIFAFHVAFEPVRIRLQMIRYLDHALSSRMLITAIFLWGFSKKKFWLYHDTLFSSKIV